MYANYYLLFYFNVRDLKPAVLQQQFSDCTYLEFETNYSIMNSLPHLLANQRNNLFTYAEPTLESIQSCQFPVHILESSSRRSIFTLSPAVVNLDRFSLTHYTYPVSYPLFTNGTHSLISSSCNQRNIVRRILVIKANKMHYFSTLFW